MEAANGVIMVLCKRMLRRGGNIKLINASSNVKTVNQCDESSIKETLQTGVAREANRKKNNVKSAHYLVSSLTSHPQTISLYRLNYTKSEIKGGALCSQEDTHHLYVKEQVITKF